MKTSVKAIVFDWGDTVMHDFKLSNPKHRWGKIAWIPGSEQFLKNLSSTYCCIMATDTDHSHTQDMQAVLELVETDQYFTYFYAQNELEVKKPVPVFFKHVAEFSGFASADCVMVGNLYAQDTVGSKEAGMKTVLFNELAESGPFPQADSVINHMNELISLFDAETA